MQALPNINRQKSEIASSQGYTLIELMLVIIVVAIIASISMKSLSSVNDIARIEETKQELNLLAYAIAGNPNLVSAGVRTDYGYIGDVGALPPNLEALATNPGGYSSWDGPYFRDDLSSGGADVHFKNDGWGKAYQYSAGVTIASSGGSSTITRQIAVSTSALLFNKVATTITDNDNSPPGITYKDSVLFILSYPDGFGGIRTRSLNPGADGFVEVDSVPIGLHNLQVIYLPTNDTLRRKINVDLGQDYYAETHFYNNIWTSGGGGGGSGNLFEILRPMGIGSSSALTTSGCSNNWECVDDVISDDAGTLVKGSGNSWLNDTYETQNSSVGAGTIDSIRIYVRCKGGSPQLNRTALITNGNAYNGADTSPSASYTDYSTTYISNPNTSAAWTWTEIDAMEIGVWLKGPASCTQVWAAVYYTP